MLIDSGCLVQTIYKTSLHNCICMIIVIVFVLSLQLYLYDYRIWYLTKMLIDSGFLVQTIHKTFHENTQHSICLIKKGALCCISISINITIVFVWFSQLYFVWLKKLHCVGKLQRTQNLSLESSSGLHSVYFLTKSITYHGCLHMLVIFYDNKFSPWETETEAIGRLKSTLKRWMPRKRVCRASRHFLARPSPPRGKQAAVFAPCKKCDILQLWELEADKFSFTLL